MKTRFFSVLAILFFCCSSPIRAADWPQWRGPDRTGVSKETGLLTTWPKEGPPMLWSVDKLGLGFSGPAIIGERLYIMGAHDGKTYVFALDIANKGREIWKTEVGEIFTFEGNKYGDGPRSTPTMDGDFLYALTGNGDVVCLATANGELQWKKNLKKDFGGVMMTEWGYSESVLIDGDRLICTPGGEKGTLAALDKKTGEVIWRSKELKDKATYSSVVAAEIGGVRQYIAMTFVNDIDGSFVAGVAADDGKLLWYVDHARGSSYGVIPTPIVKGNEVYVTAGYGAGCQLLKISKNDGKLQAEKQYSRRTQKYMKNTQGGVVLVGDHVYGHSERYGWVCQEWKTGDLVWDNDRNLRCESGALIAADGHLYLYSDEGVCVLLKASPEGWQEDERFTIPKKSDAPQTRVTSRYSKIWTPPVIANGRLYLRDQEYLFCFDISAKK